MPVASIVPFIADPAPFRCLGYDHGVYYYLATGTRQVHAITQHAKSDLLKLAPLQYWERDYGTKKGADWDAAANALMRLSEQAGVYDPSRLRGRGAWWDEGGVTLHLGGHLIKAGQPQPLSSQSAHLYEAAAPMRLGAGQPLSRTEAMQFLHLCQLFSWEHPLHAALLAGWCVIAPICGALTWRPHLWITGPAGSGKSWVYEHILSKSLGDCALLAASETTGAGLRQVLGSDARPILFDEAEGETSKAQQRIANVLSLMRQASSETGASIYKGTMDGTAMTFRIRSCFAFCSIGIGVRQHADQTRVTIISLTIPSSERAEKFAAIQRMWHDTLSETYIDRLHTRTISLIPQIRANAETFAIAGAKVFGTRRLGDQIGALIAGTYSLHSPDIITLETAMAWLAKQDWADERHTQEDRDEIACCQTLQLAVVPVLVPVGSGTTRYDRSIGELIAIAAGGSAETTISLTVARDTLARLGIRVDDDEQVHIANAHPAIAHFLASTPWAQNWHRILRRLDGATAGAPLRFAGARIRVTTIPLSTLFAAE